MRRLLAKHFAVRFYKASWLDTAFGIIATEDPNGFVTLTSKYPGEFRFCDFVDSYLRKGLSSDESFKQEITLKFEADLELMVLIEVDSSRLTLYIKKNGSEYRYRIMKM